MPAAIDLPARVLAAFRAAAARHGADLYWNDLRCLGALTPAKQSAARWTEAMQTLADLDVLIAPGGLAPRYGVAGVWHVALDDDGPCQFSGRVSTRRLASRPSATATGFQVGGGVGGAGGCATPRTCQWIDGDPSRRGMAAMCGQPAYPGKPYCEEHCRQAYRFKVPGAGDMPWDPDTAERLLAAQEKRAVSNFANIDRRGTIGREHGDAHVMRALAGGLAMARGRR